MNAYIKDGKRDVQYEDCIYVLFQPTDLDKFKMFLDEEYKRTKNIVDDYDYEGGYVVVVYELDNKWEKDLSLVKQGKYSKTSIAFKNIFPKTVKVLQGGFKREEQSIQHRIFTKSKELKDFWEEHLGVELDDDMEFWQGWIEEKEILYIEQIIKQDVQPTDSQ